MTVADLIQKLSKLDPNAALILVTDPQGWKCPEPGSQLVAVKDDQTTWCARIPSRPTNES